MKVELEDVVDRLSAHSRGVRDVDLDVLLDDMGGEHLPREGQDSFLDRRNFLALFLGSE